MQVLEYMILRSGGLRGDLRVIFGVLICLADTFVECLLLIFYVVNLTKGIPSLGKAKKTPKLQIYQYVSLLRIRTSSVQCENYVAPAQQNFQVLDNSFKIL